MTRFQIPFPAALGLASPGRVGVCVCRSSCISDHKMRQQQQQHHHHQVPCTTGPEYSTIGLLVRGRVHTHLLRRAFYAALGLCTRFLAQSRVSIAWPRSNMTFGSMCFPHRGTGRTSPRSRNRTSCRNSRCRLPVPACRRDMFGL